MHKRNVITRGAIYISVQRWILPGAFTSKSQLTQILYENVIKSQKVGHFPKKADAFQGTKAGLMEAQVITHLLASGQKPSSG